jgi:hypothetical protein
MKASGWCWSLGICLGFVGTYTEFSYAQQQVDLRVKRWLEVEQVMGRAVIGTPQSQRPAQQGDRLQQVGDQLTTQSRSTARLIVDTGIGTVDVAPDTQMIVRELQTNPDDSRTSRLYIPYGRIKVRLRKFTHPNTEFQLETPAGISGVRGTEFGLVVQPSGKTGVAVLEGAVKTSAQGVDVAVDQGFQNVIIPGEPPSDPVPLQQDTGLQYRFERRIANQQRRLRLLGQVDGVNSILVDGQPQSTDRQGEFAVDIPAVSFPRVQVLVTTPLGEEKLYTLRFR